MERAKDLRAKTVSTMVTLGESTTWGYSVSDKSECWPNRVAAMIEAYQGQKVNLINQGIGSNVLTPLCPAYEFSAKPSALERLEGDVIVHKPDILFVSYGLNDARAGTPVEVFRSEYQKLIDMVRESCPDTLIVLLNMYYMHECMYSECYDQNWNNSNYNVTDVYNMVIAQLAADNGLILADIYSATAGVDWLVDQDHCHPNALGHQVIANKVFEAVAKNASFVAAGMPKEPNILRFVDQYENGPDIPSCHDATSDLVVEATRKAFQK